MHYLLVTVRVPPEKQREFMASAQLLARNPRNLSGDPIAFVATDDERCVLCLSRWESGTDIQTFLESDTFRALRGALRTLGEDGAIRVLSDTETPGSPAGSKRGTG